MPTDEELQIAKVSRAIFPRADVTKFYIIPPPEVRKIGSVLVGDPTELLVQDTSNLSEGLFIFAEFIPSGTSIVSIVGNTITMSASASEAFTNRDVTFYTEAEDGLLPHQSKSNNWFYIMTKLYDIVDIVGNDSFTYQLYADLAVPVEGTSVVNSEVIDGSFVFYASYTVSGIAGVSGFLSGISLFIPTESNGDFRADTIAINHFNSDDGVEFSPLGESVSASYIMSEVVSTSCNGNFELHYNSTSNILRILREDVFILDLPISATLQFPPLFYSEGLNYTYPGTSITNVVLAT